MIDDQSYQTHWEWSQSVEQWWSYDFQWKTCRSDTLQGKGGYLL